LNGGKIGGEKKFIRQEVVQNDGIKNFKILEICILN